MANTIKNVINIGHIIIIIMLICVLLIFAKILIGLSTVAPAAVQCIHNGCRSKFGARSTRRVRWQPEDHSEMWSQLLQLTTQGQILGRNHQRFERQWFRTAIRQLSWIVYIYINTIYCIYFVFRNSQENFYVRRMFSEEKPEETRAIRSHYASLRRFSRLQIWYKL